MSTIAPPPRPSATTPPPSTPAAPRSTKIRQSTKMPRTTTITIRWDAVTTTIVALLIGISIGIGIATTINVAVVNEHGGLPACTDEIADAGGMCWGEPR